MKTVYEASNSVEAHMVLNLLEQSGISGTIVGEYLQGGMGELPASGFIAVQVEDQDFLEANKVITDWEAEEPVRIEAKQPSRNIAILGTVAGFIIGAGLVVVLDRTPITERGIDYTGNGVYDEKWYWAGGRASKTEIDRNRDGVVDLIQGFDRKGLINTTMEDNDFDGTFETLTNWHEGNPKSTKVDQNGDGIVEFITEYKHGVFETMTWFNPVGLKVRKKQYFKGNRLNSAEIDSDGDGIIDTLVEYDDIEEISKKSNKAFYTDAGDAGAG